MSNRRDIDIYKDGIVNIDFNIDFNNREIDNNSNCEIINDEYRDYNYNRKASIISISIRKTNIININPKYRKDDDENNNKHIIVNERTYSKNEIYNCKRGATTARPRRY